MIETLKRIYKNTKNELYLSNAIKKGWITEKEKIDIIIDVK